VARSVTIKAEGEAAEAARKLPQLNAMLLAEAGVGR